MGVSLISPSAAQSQMSVSMASISFDEANNDDFSDDGSKSVKSVESNT
eukprot:CAMPEP_0170471740 /NCGR_PEP_ID=MMETSP0123-20130129/13909_1 /TAXON_ID=182087 /ORGANISM="Favella ehrenbergii, Strain Fehren 1" /LENGTH=47 /DNA_ID= /DNA_START= /DNA_END= /DNA_ORIENTATION=